jgi:hypothetical protein
MYIRAVVRRLDKEGGSLVTTFWCTFISVAGTDVPPVVPETQAHYKDWQTANIEASLQTARLVSCY